MWNLKMYYSTVGDNIISHLHLLTIFLLKNGLTNQNNMAKLDWLFKENI